MDIDFHLDVPFCSRTRETSNRCNKTRISDAVLEVIVTLQEGIADLVCLSSAIYAKILPTK